MTPPRAHRTALLLPLLILLTAPALAQTRYDVEIVVFQQTGADGGEERWRPGIVVPEFARAGSFETSDAAASAGSTAGATEPGTTEAGLGQSRAALKPLPEGFERLPADSARLRQAVARLESSGRYRVLRHLHWRQPSLAPGESVPVRVSAGQPIEIRVPAAELEHLVPAAGNTEATRAEEEEEPATNGSGGDRANRDDPEDADGQTTSTGDTQPHGSLDIAGPFGLELRPPRIRQVSVRPLDGTVELVVSRYLHMHADLYYTTDVEWERTVIAEGVGPDTAAGASNARDDDMTTAVAAAAAPRIARGPGNRPMLSFPFEQQRRMRSGELHYLDHPLLGLLVLVTPYEAPDGDAETAEEGA